MNNVLNSVNNAFTVSLFTRTVTKPHQDEIDAKNREKLKIAFGSYKYINNSGAHKSRLKKDKPSQQHIDA